MASGNITSLHRLWVEAVEEPPGVPEAWHEGKGENDPARMQLALRFNLSEAIAERSAFNCECERHDLLACKMQGHDVCFAAVTRLRTFIKAIECAAVVYGGHEQRR